MAKTTVGIRVSGNETLRNKIQSFVGREFRKLGDVTIVDENVAEFVVRIVAVDETTTNNTSNGFAVAVVVTRPLSKTILRALFSTASDDHKRILENLAEENVAIEQFVLHEGTNNQLESSCAEIVADIDAKIFNKPRTAFNTMMRERK